MHNKETLYVIDDDDKKIIVYEDEKKILEVTHHGWVFGRSYSRFYLNGELILESSMNPFIEIFGSIAYRIKFQHLPSQLSLVSVWGHNRLQYDGNVIEKHIEFYGSPFAQLYFNGEECGSIFRSNGDVELGVMRRFTAYLGLRPIDNLYLLIFFIIELSGRSVWPRLDFDA